MTFEEWWDFEYVQKGFLGTQPGVLGQAFKEVAKKAWDARQSEIDAAHKLNGELVARQLAMRVEMDELYRNLPSSC